MPQSSLAGPTLSASCEEEPIDEVVNMVHQPHNGLPQPSDRRPGSWRDVVGLLIALIGFALVIGAATMTL
jgi:hypothetical protein